PSWPYRPSHPAPFCLTAHATGRPASVSRQLPKSDLMQKNLRLYTGPDSPSRPLSLHGQSRQVLAPVPSTATFLPYFPHGILCHIPDVLPKRADLLFVT